MAQLSEREDGKIDPSVAQDWIRHQSQLHRREARKVARSLFMAADDDNSGYLVREEVADLTDEMKVLYPEFELDPPLDLDVGGHTATSAPSPLSRPSACPLSLRPLSLSFSVSSWPPPYSRWLMVPPGYKQAC